MPESIFKPNPKMIDDYQYIKDMGEFEKLSNKTEDIIKAKVYDDKVFFTILDLYQIIKKITDVNAYKLSPEMKEYYEFTYLLVQIAENLVLQIVSEHRSEYDDFMKRNGFECGE